jgi:hypothetical protein
MRNSKNSKSEYLCSFVCQIAKLVHANFQLAIAYNQTDLDKIWIFKEKNLNFSGKFLNEFQKFHKSNMQIQTSTSKFQLSSFYQTDLDKIFTIFEENRVECSKSARP